MKHWIIWSQDTGIVPLYRGVISKIPWYMFVNPLSWNEKDMSYSEAACTKKTEQATK